MKLQKISTPLNPIKPLFTFEVPSKSELGKNHKVEYYEDKHFECDCIAFSFSKKPKNCKHIEYQKLKWK